MIYQIIHKQQETLEDSSQDPEPRVVVWWLGVWAESPGTDVVRWSRKFQPFRGGAVLRSPPELCFSLGSRGPAQSLSGGFLPDPAFLGDYFGQGGHAGPPARAHGVPQPALLAGRWHPPSAQSNARSGAARSGTGREVGDRAKSAAPPLAGSYQGKCHSRLCRLCSPSSLSFLPF